ncbi:MAG: hypothetical protein LHW56_09440 [Candidatus Cloacimonetes bacterium]|nr:hypothetical protein [Candidatus Cloacimonadota bacterium]MDY0173115.1 hypothetical protein [Candidatus Cloacimonadaceae bacterium]
MRKIFLLVLFSVAVLLSANPLVERAIQQFWFDDSGELMLQFGNECLSMAGFDFTISDGVNTITPVLNLPVDYQLYPFTINLSALMPVSTLSPESGHLRLSFQDRMVEEVRWGESGEVDLSPLIATQSIYQSKAITPDHESSHELWAKSDHPDFVTNYDSSTRSTITIYTKYPDASPAANIPLFYQNLWPAWAYSDAEGKIELSVHSAKTNLRIFQPGTQELVLDETFIAEPAGCYVYNVILQPSSVSDPHQEMPGVILKLSPNVLKPGQSMQLDLGKSEASPDKLRLFDVKGRILGEYPFTESWQPPQLNSGVYFLQLLQGDSTLDSARFIMLK